MVLFFKNGESEVQKNAVTWERTVKLKTGRAYITGPQISATQRCPVECQSLSYPYIKRECWIRAKDVLEDELFQ